MSTNTPSSAQGGQTPPPFPFGTLVRVLLIPLAAVVIFILLFLRPGQEPSGGAFGEGEDDLRRIALIQKDASFQPIPASEGGATGSVWYTRSGAPLELQLRAEGLEPGRRYLLEIAADTTIYTVASLAADRDGEIALDTTLTHFAEGVCVGPNYDPPRPLAGRHALKFWVKNDGNPPSGSGRVHAPRFTEGQDLPCSGNGDGDYTYVLFENEVAEYTGAPAAPSGRGSRDAPAAARPEESPL